MCPLRHTPLDDGFLYGIELRQQVGNMANDSSVLDMHRLLLAASNRLSNVYLLELWK